MSININIPLDDIGLFKTKRNKREQWSQRERADMVAAQFAHCMHNALNGTFCAMPGLCAHGVDRLVCAHLDVPAIYANFTGGGIPLPMDRRKKFDERLRAIGTLVYRQTSHISGPFAGDIHIPSLQKIAQYTGGPRKSKATPKAKPRAAPAKRSGFLARLFG